MVSVIAGCATAFFFAVGMIAASQASRAVPAVRVVALAAVVSSLIVIPWALLDGIPEVTSQQVLLMVVSGVGNVGGFLCVYTALKYGKVGLVAPIVATEGGIAAVVASLLGDTMDPFIALLLLFIVIGIMIGARSADPEPFPGERPGLAALMATLGAFFFAGGLVAVGMMSGELPLAWVLLPARLVGGLLIALPLAVTMRLRVPRRTFLWVVLLAVADIVAISIYTVGAAENLSVTAVLSSQMAPIAAVLAFLLFKERLGRGQVLGLVIMVTGVTLLGLMQ
ncbi:MAG TPA: hypothetical protein DCQ36_03120 [Actinobacteria bacterium]|jgi:drug/metabolite transporter (DMT)-like permease|nr:hypothetical protein [Actinomycetota bacterium]